MPSVVVCEGENRADLCSDGREGAISNIYDIFCIDYSPIYINRQDDILQEIMLFCQGQTKLCF